VIHIFQTVSHFGGIDILVSNAATNPAFGQILDVSLTTVPHHHIAL